MLARDLLAVAAALAGALLSACHAAPEQRVGPPPEDGWIKLFDGTSTDAWRGFRQKTLPPGWRIEGDALARLEGGGDIVTREEFQDFELELDWKIAPGGNSGILFHVDEDHDAVWQSGPEMQVLDDERHPDGKDPRTSAGANYALHPAPRGLVKPAGEWNHVRLLVDGDRVRHELNGALVCEYRLGGDEWTALVQKSKFAAMPDYGRNKRGHIALQDHGDSVWYRAIRIRRLS